MKIYIHLFAFAS